MLCTRCKKRPAVVFMTTMEKDARKSEGYCLVCAKELGIGPVEEAIKAMGINEEQLSLIADEMAEMMDENGDMPNLFELGGAQTFPLSEKSEGENKDKNNKKENGDKKKKFKFLDNFCTNLTKKARMGEIDAVIGRQREIERVTQILSRRSKNNPCLIGEPGVGKTAIVEGIAIKIAEKNVPQRLMDKEIYLLDLTSLVAGTQFRGQFESRIKGLIDEVKNAGNVILFIDEVHNLVGTGDSEGSMSAANILKPSLSRGEIQVIGATTFTEYRKHIEKDSALERRFQPVTVNEPSIEDAIEVLKGIKKYYEEYHNAILSDDIVVRAVSLSERYITDRFLPDKAIDLIDEGCAFACLKNSERNLYDKKKRQLDALKSDEGKLASAEEVNYEALANVRAEICKVTDDINKIDKSKIVTRVTVNDLAGVIELWTGIPASKIEQNERAKLSSLKERLSEKIIGQDKAVDAVVRAITRNRAGLSPRKRPSSFIFVGPTGVGKTELVKVLGAELFDATEPIIRLDMSEYMEKHAVSKIIGSPPGYIGYDEAGQLTEKVRRKPYSVILFDEIEKAHPDVLNILLQLLDEGKLTDAHGRTVSFENTVIVMTSNAGSELRGFGMGFNKTEGELMEEKAKKALSEFLRPEFLSRVDEVVVFNNLSEKELVKISRLMVKELESSLNERGIDFICDDKALEIIVFKADGGKFAARDLRHIIRKEIEDKIAFIYTNSEEGSLKAFKVTAENGEVKVYAE
ncbi:MAG: ATP-dependent Clp protease ATP-binding subunit [Oscillospiraceae bacterium]|nr:ATP-dependent Clp protease ATP-binding subunit [Oscillospiraceae bacterium]